VIGFDNWEVLTTNARPELTSIDPDLQQLGRLAAQRVFAALAEVDVGSGTQYLPGRLVIRGSTVARR
jgi:LacI family transcriptional regulator